LRPRKEALKLVERLLARMSLELGKSEEFWRKELERIKDIVVVNPFPGNLVKEYHEYIEGRIKRRESH
jgi:hypothetical protein